MIDTRSLVDHVYEYLLSQIITGEIKYGEAINIKKIASTLSVSTMPVREALKRLEFERILSIKPRSSCRLIKPSRKLMLEVCELREVIELYAVTSSGGKIEPSRFAKLDSIVDEMRRLDQISDIAVKEKKAIALDRAFHSEICNLAGNEFMNSIHRQLSLHVNMTLIHEKTYHKLEKQWAESHAEIVKCLEHDPQRAADVLRLHFNNVFDLLPADGEDSGNPEE